MYDLKSVSIFAISAYFWFANFGVNKIDWDLGFTFETLKHGSFHFRINITASDNDSSEGDKFINMFMIETSHQCNLR